MKLFLTSNAVNVLEKIVPKLLKKPEELKVMFIPTAGDPYEEKPWLEADRGKLVELGFQVTDFDLKEKTEAEIREAVSKVDIIFVAGGNTFYLLEKARKSGFEKVIKELKNSDKIYIGSSAGSIIAGPNLEPVRDFDHPEKANLDSNEAFGLVDFVIMPHWGREKYAARQENAIKEFGKKYKLKPLKDDEMVVILI